jgi:hypothetical protein
VFELREQFPLVDYRSDRLLIYYFDLGELLHGIKRLKLLAFDFPYLQMLKKCHVITYSSKTALAED